LKNTKKISLAPYKSIYVDLTHGPSYPYLPANPSTSSTRCWSDPPNGATATRSRKRTASPPARSTQFSSALKNFTGSKRNGKNRKAVARRATCTGSRRKRVPGPAKNCAMLAPAKSGSRLHRRPDPGPPTLFRVARR
jgi:hypothetical protein